MADSQSGSMYHVYMLASGRHGTLYTGVTNSIRGRRATSRRPWIRLCCEIQAHRLVYLESYESPGEAIQREKQLKNWKRDWKISLIEADNPNGWI
jgi:putative endonuclease